MSPRKESFGQFSLFLQREVTFDCYLPPQSRETPHLLLINDGQDLGGIGFAEMLSELQERAHPALWVVALHAAPGTQRLQEYGTSRHVDYQGRGCKAALYTRFVLRELLPFLENRFHQHFPDRTFAGFSMGGLSALDIVWNHPQAFQKAGVFSGSLWWRSSDDGSNHRIMHRQVREGAFHPGLRFFFEAGTEDDGESESAADTEALVQLLEEKGYEKGRQIEYTLVQGGRHDWDTWKSVLPGFLEWVVKA
ncbi:alpha/beta hydrolase [Chitinophaga lutea]